MIQIDTPSLSDLFNEYFELEYPCHGAALDELYSLRYQVYCLENGYEDSSAFPDQKEYDDFDSNSWHAIIRHKETGLAAATVRLIIPLNHEELIQLPIENHCRESFIASGFSLSEKERRLTAEISRFAVSKEFKKRAGEAKTISGISPGTVDYEGKQRAGARMFPHITLGLFKAIVKMSHDNNIQAWYAVMEPALLRLLKRFGINFSNIGDVIEYHGIRQPCYNQISTVLDGIKRNRLEVWDFITESGRLDFENNVSE